MKKSDVSHKSVKGDGNCLFHAVVKYLDLDRKYGYSEQKETHHQLRLKCVDWLRNNLDLRTDSGITIRDHIQFFVDDNDKLKTVNDYFKMMSKNRSYGGQIEIFAISHLLNRNIKTYIDKGNRYSSIGLGNEVKQLRSHDTINLYHNINDVGSEQENMFHFEILYPKYKINWNPNKKEDVSKKIKHKKLGKKIEKSKRRSVRRRSQRRSQRRSVRRSQRRRSVRRRSQRRSQRKRSQKRRSVRRNQRRSVRRRSQRRSVRRSKI